MEASRELAKIGAPRSLSEWKACATRVADCMARALRSPSGKTYGVLRATRAWLKFRMAASGANRLRVGSFTKVADLLHCFPDQRRRLEQLGQGHTYLQALFDELGYDGSPELFTMWCCLFGDVTVREMLKAQPSGWLRHNATALRGLRAKCREQTGMWPHPAVLLRMIA